MVRVEQPVELAAAPVHERHQPRIERLEDALEPIYRARLERPALQPRDDGMAAAGPPAQLRLGPVASVSQRTD